MDRPKKRSQKKKRKNNPQVVRKAAFNLYIYISLFFYDFMGADGVVVDGEDQGRLRR